MLFKTLLVLICYDEFSNYLKCDLLQLDLKKKVQVVSDGTTLHTIDANEFLDSPEFESSRASVEDKFRVTVNAFIILTHNINHFILVKVSIIATGTSRYISWQRSTLEYLFVKETVLANVFCILVARDVINKVFAMNKKVCRIFKFNKLSFFISNIL